MVEESEALETNKAKQVLREVLVACIGGSILFGVYLGYDFATGKLRPSHPVVALQLGTIFPGFESLSKSNDRTVVIATSKSCKNSLDNLAFHRQLIASAKISHLNVVVLVPDKESEQFMMHELSVKDARIEKLSGLGITGTPTIAVVDSSHRIQHLWSGSLPHNIQDTVLAQVVTGLHMLSNPNTSQVFLQTDTVRSSQASTLPPNTPGRVSGESQDVVEKLSDTELAKRLINAHLLDVSSRDVFSQFGRKYAVNIPFDELKMRASRELNRDVPWVIDCSHVDGGVCDMASYEFEKSGFRLAKVLDRNAMGATCQTTPAI